MHLYAFVIVAKLAQPTGPILFKFGNSYFKDKKNIQKLYLKSFTEFLPLKGMVSNKK